MRKPIVIVGVVLLALGSLFFVLREFSERRLVIRTEGLLGIVLIIVGIALTLLGIVLKPSKSSGGGDSFRMGY